MKTRRLVPEMMDAPDLDAGVHRQALAGLHRLNRATGSAALAWGPIRDLARSAGATRLRVLDVATGGGDVPIALWRRAARHGLALEIDACDISPVALEYAAAAAERAGASIRWRECDVLADFPAERYDVVVASLFLHHLTEPEIGPMLRRMRAAATRRVVIIDLARSHLNLWKVWFAARVLTRSPVVHFDAPQSVRAAHTPDEFAALARGAGFEEFVVERCWPCRFRLIERTDGARHA